MPALDHSLEAAGDSALLVLLQAVLQVEAEEGGVVAELPEDPGTQGDLVRSPLPGLSGLPGLPVQTLPVLPQCGARGQE